MSRFNRLSAVLGVALLLGANTVRADELRPIEGRTIVLGSITGVAYYTTEADGDRLVATLADPDGGTPFRVITVLAAGQSMTLSVPRGAGQPAIEVAFTRRGDRVFVSESGSITN